MIEERNAPGPGATGAEGCIKEFKQSETSIQGLESQEEDELREALIAELRCELVLSKMDTLKIERLGVALKNRLISVRQCLARQLADDTAAFAGMEGGP
jgi:hypothetical protein